MNKRGFWSRWYPVVVVVLVGATLACLHVWKTGTDEAKRSVTLRVEADGQLSLRTWRWNAITNAELVAHLDRLARHHIDRYFDVASILRHDLADIPVRIHVAHDARWGDVRGVVRSVVDAHFTDVLFHVGQKGGGTAECRVFELTDNKKHVAAPYSPGRFEVSDEDLELAQWVIGLGGSNLPDWRFDITVVVEWDVDRAGFLYSVGRGARRSAGEVVYAIGKAVHKLREEKRGESTEFTLFAMAYRDVPFSEIAALITGCREQSVDKVRCAFLETTEGARAAVATSRAAKERATRKANDAE